MAPVITDQTEDVPVDEILANFGPLEAGAPLPEEWQALEQALRLGGVLRDGVYVLPFIEREAPVWRPGTARLFIAGENVGVRAEPETTAPLVTRVSRALVQEATGVPTRPAPPDRRAWTGRPSPVPNAAWSGSAPPTRVRSAASTTPSRAAAASGS